MANGYGVAEVLECYLQASACTDRRAHCHAVIDDPYSAEGAEDDEGFTLRSALDPSGSSQRVKVDRYLFPCSFLKQRFRFQTDHPAIRGNRRPRTALYGPSVGG